MMAIELKTRQRKLLKLFVCYGIRPSRYRDKYYFSDGHEFKPDAPIGRFLVEHEFIEKFHSWYHATNLGREYKCWDCNNGKHYPDGDAAHGITCDYCDGLGITALPYIQPHMRNK